MRPLHPLLLIAIPLTAIQAETVNIITNGTFETGSTSGWGSTAAVAGGFSLLFGEQTNGSWAAYASTALQTIANNTGQIDTKPFQNFVIPSVPIPTATLTRADTVAWDGAGTFRGVNVFAGPTIGGNQINYFTVSNPSSIGNPLGTNHSEDVTALLNANIGQNARVRFISTAYYYSRDGANFSSAPTLKAASDAIAFNNAPRQSPGTVHTRHHRCWTHGHGRFQVQGCGINRKLDSLQPNASQLV